MKRLALAIMLALALGYTSATAQTASLRGVWIGAYQYDDGRPEVKFQAKLNSEAGKLSGTTIEPNTFGNSSALFLTANLRGALGAGGRVSFTKTYDGTGGEAGSVQYAGALDAARRCIKGKWSLDKQTTGAFEICTGALPTS